MSLLGDESTENTAAKDRPAVALTWRTISCLAGAIAANHSPSAKAFSALHPPAGPPPMRLEAKPKPPIGTFTYSMTSY